MPRVLQHGPMVIKVDCVLRHMCETVHGHCWVALTLACWNGATPGAIASAGPHDSVVPSYHHIPQLAHECHILAYSDVITNSKSICGNTRVAAGYHCQTQETCIRSHSK